MRDEPFPEEDVRRFLYDVNLAHLYVASKDDARESAGGFWTGLTRFTGLRKIEGMTARMMFARGGAEILMGNLFQNGNSSLSPYR